MEVLQVAAGKLHSGGGSITIGQVRLRVAGTAVSMAGSPLPSFLAAQHSRTQPPPQTFYL